MDFLYIPLIGAVCLLAILCLLIVSLCIHFRKADSTRIRFLKHSYQSTWLEAPGFCEVQHRNYIYSYQQSSLMACGSDKKCAAAQNRVSIALNSGDESLTLEPNQSQSDTKDGGDDSNTLASYEQSPIDRSRGRRSAVFRQRPMTVSFEDETASHEENALLDLDASTTIDSSSNNFIQSRHYSLPSTTSSDADRKPGGKRLALVSQLKDAEVELATCEIGEDEYAENDEEEDVDAPKMHEIIGENSAASAGDLPGTSSGQRTKPNPHQKQIRSVLKDFYQSVQVMKLEGADPSNESLQKLAREYGDHVRFQEEEPQFFSIEEELDEEQDELEEQPKLHRDLSEPDMDNYNSWLRDCVQASHKKPLRHPGHLSAGDALGSIAHSSTTSSGGAASSPRPGYTSGEGIAGITKMTLGHASGLRRFLFSSSGGRPNRHQNTERQHDKLEKATKLAPRLSSSQSSV